MCIRDSNKASAYNSLKIKVYNEDNVLVFVNNLQPKIKGTDSKGVGLKNLRKRYEYLSEQGPQFTVTEREYIAKIPLIKPE